GFWLFFFGWRNPEFCTAVTLVSASLRAIVPRHFEGWTLRSARNWRFSAGLKVASYARRARASYRQANSAKTANAIGSAKGIIADTYHMSDRPRGGPVRDIRAIVRLSAAKSRLASNWWESDSPGLIE